MIASQAGGVGSSLLLSIADSQIRLIQVLISLLARCKNKRIEVKPKFWTTMVAGILNSYRMLHLVVESTGNTAPANKSSITVVLITFTIN